MKQHIAFSIETRKEVGEEILRLQRLLSGNTS
jgi:hypothetical protein